MAPVIAPLPAPITTPVTTPVPGQIAAPAPAETKPSFDIARVDRSGQAVVAGRAQPDATVTLLDNGKPVAKAQADSNGQFVIIPKAPLPSGGQELSLSQAGADGKVTAGDTPVLLVLPDRAPPPKLAPSPAPTPAPLPAEPVLAVLTPPNAPPVVLQGPPPVEGEKLQLQAVDYTDKGAIGFAGTATPGAMIRLYIDNQPAGEARADARGRWNLMPDILVSAGVHALRMDELTSSGAVAQRIEVPFQRAEPAVVEVTSEEHAGGRIVVQPTQNLWRIARHVYGKGMLYTDIFRANRDQIKDPNLIFPGQIFALPPNAVTPPSSSTLK